MQQQQSGGAKLAGVVLAFLGFVTYGATSPFALVLCIEWLKDSRPAPHHRLWDWIGLVLAVPGTAIFVWMSVGFFDYAPGGMDFAWMIIAYWLSFLIWLVLRARTRWRELQNDLSETSGTTHDDENNP